MVQIIAMSCEARKFDLVATFLTFIQSLLTIVNPQFYMYDKLSRF